MLQFRFADSDQAALIANSIGLPMSKSLLRADFQALQYKLETGNASLRMPKQIAHQFFSCEPNESVVSIARKSVFPKKLTIFLLYSAPLSLLMVSLGLVFVTFEWIAAVTIAAIGIFWSILVILTSDKDSYGAFDMMVEHIKIGDTHQLHSQLQRL